MSSWGMGSWLRCRGLGRPSGGRRGVRREACVESENFCGKGKKKATFVLEKKMLNACGWMGILPVLDLWQAFGTMFV